MLGVVLVLIIFIGLVSCKNTKDAVKLNPESPITLTIWHYYHGPQQIAFDKMVEDFNSTVGLKNGIILEAYGYGSVNELSAAALDSANEKIGSKPMPNMFACYSDGAIQIDNMKKLANMEDYMSKDELKQYIPSFVEEGRLGADNSLKIFPIAKSSEIGMLNKTDFDKFVNEIQKDNVHISYDDLKTFEGITKVAEEYYKWTDAKTPEIKNDGKAFFGVDSIANFMNVVSHQMGKDLIVVKDGTAKVAYDEQSIHKLWELYYKNMIKGYFTSKGRFRSDDAKTGDLIYLVGATTGAAYFPAKVTVESGDSHAIEMMALPMPIIENGKKVVIQQGAGMCVSKSTKEKEYASILFLKWFTDAERNIDFSIDSSGYMPVKNSPGLEEAVQSKMSNLINSTTDKGKLVGYQNTSLVMGAFLEQFKTYEMFFAGVFNNSSKVRSLLDEFEKSTVAAVHDSREEMGAGASYDDVVSKYCSEDEFKKWYNSFDVAIKKMIN